MDVYRVRQGVERPVSQRIAVDHDDLGVGMVLAGLFQFLEIIRFQLPHL